MIHATHITYMSSEKEAALGLPQLGLRLIADSNSWIVNATPNLKSVSLWGGCSKYRASW